MTETLEQEVLTQEEILTRATRTIDVEVLDRIYADDLTMTGVLGEPTCDKTTVMDEAKRGVAQRDAAAAGGKQFVGSYEKEDLKVVALGDTGVATYRFVVTFTGEGVNTQRRYRTTNVWMKRQGRWQVVAAHTALVLDAKQVASLGAG